MLSKENQTYVNHSVFKPRKWQYVEGVGLNFKLEEDNNGRKVWVVSEVSRNTKLMD